MTATIAPSAPLADHLDSLASALGARFGQLKGDDVESFEDFVTRTKPNYQWSRFHRLLAAKLQAVADGELERLMVFCPPQHGKSEMISRKFPAYYVRRYPERMVGLAAHTSSFAHRFGRQARSAYIEAGGVLEPGAGQVGAWETPLGGGMWSAGIGSGISGNPAWLLLLDDEFKHAKDASSAQGRLDHHEWWDSTFYSRLQPGGAIVIVMTRWAEDDLAGYVLEKEEGPAPEGWTILSLPALADEEPHLFPSTCDVVEDWREPGEALWPERYTREIMEGRRARTLPYYWEAVYQQRPREEAGRGRVCRDFGSHNLRELKDLDLPLIVGMDFNVDPMSATIGSDVGGQLHVFDELVLPDSDTRDCCREIAERYPGREVVVCPDPSGRARKTSAGGVTDFKIIESFGFEIDAPPSPPAVVDRINTFNAACRERADHPPLVFVDPEKCPKLVMALMKLTTVPGSRKVDKKKGWDHLFDAISYKVCRLYPMDGMFAISESIYG